MNFQGKIAVVTGSNRGIGKSIVEQLLISGAKVFACVRKKNDEYNNYLSSLNSDLKSNLITIEFDLSNDEQLKKGVEQIKSQTKKIDMIVNNAGAIDTAILQMTTEKKIQDLFKVNFFSQFNLTQKLAKSMILNKSGSIVFVSSTSSIDGNFGRGAYSASKSAINSLALVLSRELGQYNIRVNCIAPGMTDTEMATGNTTKEVIEGVVRHTSLKRIGKPDEIAQTVMFLLSENSSYITGQVIRVDGGM